MPFKRDCNTPAGVDDIDFIGQQAAQFYNRDREDLVAQHDNKYVVYAVPSGARVIGKTEDEADKLALERFGAKATCVMMHIGHF